jgi:predicted dehydrogenase
VFDARVERPPHYDTFAEFQYAYHYGDMYVPYIKQEEPLKAECQHFLDCIRHGTVPLTGGRRGLELVRILEASSASLKQNGAAINLQSRVSEHASDKAELNSSHSVRLPMAQLIPVGAPG